MVEWITVRRLGIKQLREFFMFTDGPLLCVRPEETHDIHAVQSNTPAILLTDDDQDSMFHRSPTIENIRPTIHYHARLAHTSARSGQTASVVSLPSYLYLLTISFCVAHRMARSGPSPYARQATHANRLP